jgi:hypothetical protein
MLALLRPLSYTYCKGVIMAFSGEGRGGFQHDPSPEVEEMTTFREPAVAEAFARKVLVENPRLGAEPLTDDELSELLAFKDDASRDRVWKLNQFGLVLYQAQHSLTPRGFKQMFDTRADLLEGQTPWNVIDKGSMADNRLLYDWARRARSTPIS